MMEMKSWPHFFQAIKAGDKKHDLRFKGDRDFWVGRRVKLREYDPFAGAYTGEELIAEITFVTDNNTPCAFSSAILPKDYAILSLNVLESEG